MARQRTDSATLDRSLTRKFLQREYVKLKKSFDQIALETGFAPSTVARRARLFGLRREPRKRRLDLGGQRFGRLFVSHFNGTRQSRTYWYCKCDCGNEKVILGTSLTQGKTTSCGCYGHSVACTGVGDLSGDYWGRIKRNAKARGIDVAIDAEYAWELFQSQRGRCALTGRKLTLVQGYGKRTKEQSASLDRKDSRKGYVAGNVQWVHKVVNNAKGSLTNRQFRKLCQDVIDHASSKTHHRKTT